MKILAITKYDWSDLKQVRLAALKDSPDAFGATYENAIKLTPEDWQLRASQNQDPKFLIAYSQDKPVGLTGGGFNKAEYELIAMWVSPEHRGSGTANSLIEALKLHAVSEGHSEVILKVAVSNQSACRTYEKCGFEIAGNGGKLESNETIELQKMLWRASI